MGNLIFTAKIFTFNKIFTFLGLEKSPFNMFNDIYPGLEKFPFKMFNDIYPGLQPPNFFPIIESEFTLKGQLPLI